MFNRLELFTHLEPATPLFPPRELEALLKLPQNSNHPCHSFYQKQLKELQSEIESVNLDALNPLQDKAFHLYFQTGDRLSYEKEYFARRRLLSALSLMSFFHPQDSHYLESLELLLEYLLLEKTWCLPAHFGDVYGQALSPEEHPYHLDLFACETGLALAEILSLQGNSLSLDLQSRIYLAIETRILDPFMDPKNYFGFENSLSNWSAVCAGAIGTLSLHLLDDQGELTKVLHACLSSIDVYLSSFGEDGICAEGLSYWTYGFGFFTLFAQALDQKTSGKLNLFSFPKVKAIALSQQYQYLYENQVISFSDSNPRDDYRLGIGTYLQKIYPELRLPEMDYALSFSKDHCGRYSLNLRDFLWTLTSPTFGLDESDSLYFQDAQWLISKNSTSALVAKGGHNAESHNHNDVGSFLFFVKQSPILCDLGAGVYDRDYFSEKRYEAFCTHAASHNIPIINSIYQKEGRNSLARDLSVNRSETKDSIRMELAACYEDPSLISFERSLCHQKREANLLIQDCFRFNEPGNVIENFVTELELQVDDDFLLFIKEDRPYCRLSIPKELELTIQEKIHRNHDEQAISLRVLQFRTRTAKKEHNLEFTFKSIDC